ncbi:MAG: hypothetical protein FI687_04545 [SAR202 cluster bacterium]|nr:hypothetical protein [SAR202 cluster bacterium]|tara:strand:+ start:647 stop:1084 length:438 start_codon:yes stop_codon:yes gene_type:complete
MPKTKKYKIDVDQNIFINKSIKTLIANRKCYLDKQSESAESIISSDTQIHIDRIIECCSQQQDYLLPDTPIKEAIFRSIIANNNKAISASEIKGFLSRTLESGPYPRDISIELIEKILFQDNHYGIILDQPKSKSKGKQKAKKDK